MNDAPLPAAVRDWLTGCPHLDITSATDVSWPLRSASRVWRVGTRSGEVAYVKLSSSQQAYAREVHAYRHAATAFTDQEVPRLLAADPALSALATSALPGRVVLDLPLAPDVELRVHRRAGQLLARWHANPEPAPSRVRDEVNAAVAGEADDAAQCLARSASYLTRRQRALIQQVPDELPKLIEHLSIVYRHGDCGSRNWLWHAERDTVGLIDFETAHHGLAVKEFVWLYGKLWLTRPELRRAFLAGYGRELTDAEQRALHLLTVRLAASYLDTGLVEDRPELVERGRTILTRLTHVLE